MKKLLFLLLLIPFICKGQSHMYDSIKNASSDTLLVGDTLHLTLFCEVKTLSGENSDSVYLSSFSSMIYLHNFLDAYNNATWDASIMNDTVTLKYDIIIHANYGSYNDSTYTKVLLTLYHSGDNTYWVNTPRKYVYIKDTTHAKVNGINEVKIKIEAKIKEVRYYTITGQLYGIYPQKQNHLPNVPLIEEVIYMNNEISTRRLLEIN